VCLILKSFQLSAFSVQSLEPRGLIADS